MSRLIAVNRDTAYLLPPPVNEWPQNPLARFVVEAIDGLDLSELNRQYAGRGSDAYHPAMLLGFRDHVFMYPFVESNTIGSGLPMGCSPLFFRSGRANARPHLAQG